MTAGAVPVERGCGSRQAGGAYFETGLSDNGLPVEAFLFDPPGALTQETIQAMGIRPVGVTLTAPGPDGVVHVIDWIGSKFYPNVADLIEETRRYGLSRRLPKNLDFSALTRDSRIVLAHSNAVILSPEPYWRERRVTAGMVWCPKTIEDHLVPEPPFGHSVRPGPHCAGLWWDDVTGGADDLVALSEEYDERAVRRTMPAFTYRARKAPAEATGRYLPGLFAAFPCSRIVVVRDPEGGSHTETQQRASRATGIAVELEDA